MYSFQLSVKAKMKADRIARQGQRHDDAQHGLDAAGAVDQRALFELTWDRLEVAGEQPGAERDEECG